LKKAGVLNGARSVTTTSHCATTQKAARHAYAISSTAIAAAQLTVQIQTISIANRKDV
jgi:hypothetical protein